MISENTGSTGPKEPCLVKAGQGFSVLYNDRFLYSKYAPERSIIQTVSSLTILSDTLILACSPCLWLGLKELISKCPENCLILGLEDDDLLFELSKKTLTGLIEKEKSSGDCDNEYLDKLKKVRLCKTSELENELKETWKYRRAQPVEMSGGTFFKREAYSKCCNLAQNIISAYWKNRITLVKLGRLFSRNFFRNLKCCPAADSIPIHDKTVSKPLIVFGAGESSEIFIQSFRKNNREDLLKNAVIIAVDAALPVLNKNGINADYIVAVESQLAIEKAYIGSTKTDATIIRDLSSRKAVGRHTKGKNLYFFSEYATGSFIENARNAGVLPVTLPALGSVGLTAVYIALLMRKNNQVPVFITGLDFSFSLGFTHARGAPAHTTRLCTSDRKNGTPNYAAAFRQGAVLTEGKNGPVYTDTALSGYGELFNSFFEGSVNLYDAGIQGLKLSVPQVTYQDVCSVLEDSNFSANKTETENSSSDQSQNVLRDSVCKNTKEYLSKEKDALIRLKTLLMEGNKAVPSPSPDLTTEISSLLQCREYLYLHFPDGYVCQPENISFLKRIRSEIDFFLKDLTD